MEARYHSVTLDKERCRGCSNCLMHCPTQAIRVRGGRAHIIRELCIDCGQCIRVCPYHAKVAMTDSLEDLQGFRHRIALPAPSFFAQFGRGIHGLGQLFDAVRAIGFDEVYEVARGADAVTCALRELLRNRVRPRPLISSACPTVTRIIQVRFPGLIDHIVPLRQPMEGGGCRSQGILRGKGCAARRCRGVFYHALPGQNDGHPQPHWPAGFSGGRRHLHPGGVCRRAARADRFKSSQTMPIATPSGLWYAAGGE